MIPIYQARYALISKRSIPPMAAIFFIALAVRLLNVLMLQLDPETLLLGDAKMYWIGAQQAVEFGALVNELGEPNTERVPFYFLFLAAHIHLLGSEYLPVLLTQAAIDSLTCVMIGRLADAVMPGLLLSAGCLAAVWPNLWIHSGQLLSETLFLFFFVAALLALMHFLRSNAWQAVILAGMALGCATMTRPVSQFLLPVLAVFVPLRTWLVRRSVRATVMYGALFAAAAALPLLPHLIRNASQFGTLSLTSQSGNHLLRWVVPEVTVLAKRISRSEAVAEMNQRAQLVGQSLGIDNVDAAPPFVQSHVFLRTAITALREMPARYLVQAWFQGALVNLAAPAILIDNRVQRLPHDSFMEATTGNLWHRFAALIRSSSPTYLAVVVAGLVFAAAASLLQLAGLIIHFHRQFWIAMLGVGVALYFLLINGPIASPKYRLPFEPILIVWTALAIEAFRAWRIRSRLPSLGYSD